MLIFFSCRCRTTDNRSWYDTDTLRLCRRIEPNNTHSRAIHCVLHSIRRSTQHIRSCKASGSFCVVCVERAHGWWSSQRNWATGHRSESVENEKKWENTFAVAACTFARVVCICFDETLFRDKRAPLATSNEQRASCVFRVRTCVSVRERVFYVFSSIMMSTKYIFCSVAGKHVSWPSGNRLYETMKNTKLAIVRYNFSLHSNEMHLSWTIDRLLHHHRARNQFPMWMYVCARKHIYSPRRMHTHIHTLTRAWSRVGIVAVCT